MNKAIEKKLQERVGEVLPGVDPGSVLARPCDPKFGDYQTNALMGLAKERKQTPRALAAEVMKGLDVSEWCDKVEIAGAGYLNFWLKADSIAATLQSAARGEHLFFEKTERPRKVVVDFSSPNVAKPMHVGHIRSTILGESIVRILRALGHHVITDNHIGDWGTQFGKLIYAWKKGVDRAALASDPMGTMEALYRAGNAAFEADEAVKTEARQELLKLQQGDPENLAIWKEMIDLSLKAFGVVYDRLGVKFDHTLGESFYNPRLPGTVRELVESGIARESEGAIAVFFDDIPELKGQPALIQKSDGAANYTTTDLATLTYRVEEWHPDEIVYVTDGRQQHHFKQLFAIWSRWKPSEKAKLSHVWFGMILGDDGKPFKTRTGENIKLTALLDEAEERALAVVTAKNPDLPEDQRREIARAVGIGAIKYSDLSPNRQSDYVFSWDKMLALTGNTVPYLQYAYTRTRSILRKATEGGGVVDPQAKIELKLPEEIALAKHLLKFGLVLEAVAEEYRPNYLCNYLFELAGFLARFYENCPVLKAEGAERASRLVVCRLLGEVLKAGLEMLGIETTETM